MAPRTGSTWARQALRNAAVRYKEWGPKHSVALPSGDKAPVAPGFRFTFVRQPAAWVRSRWTLGPWEDELATFWRPDPDEFAAAVTPAMVDMYFAKYKQLASFVGDTENLADDLVAALRQAGEKFDERTLRATPRLNESGPGYHLLPGAFHDLTEGQLAGLPDGELERAPVELLRTLPESLLDTLSGPALKALTRRLLTENAPPRPRDVPIFVGS